MTTTAKATRLILDRLAAGTTLMLSVHLTLPDVPAWCDGIDADGHAVLLIGAHALRQTPEGVGYIEEVLAALKAGELPPGVAAVRYAPRASEVIVTAVAAPGVEEVLAWGPRNTGKTMLAPGMLAVMAELHARAGYPLPLKCLWLHDSLKNARAKTAQSLEQAMWSGLWRLREDRLVAGLVIGGVEYVTGNFVGCKDDDAAEGLRAECSVVVAEELLASLEEGGIERRKFDLARSSMRTPTRHPVALGLTNPGSLESWVHKRWIAAGGEPGTRAIEVPASDRLSREQDQAQQRTFTDPDLQARLGRGEWTDLLLGEKVTQQFTDAHIAKGRLRPVENVRLWLGHDGGHTPTTVIGAHYQGSLLIYAALSSTQAGTRQHVQQLVRPWLAAHAPWALRHPSTMLAHRYDPAMATGEQADIDQDPVRVLRELLGGPMDKGAVDWPGRLEPILALFRQFNPYTNAPTLQIDPIDGALLIRALRGMWIYPTVNGVVSRDLPVKNHPWSDLGDSFAYAIGGIAPSRPPRPDPAKLQKHAISRTSGFERDGRVREASSSSTRWSA